MLNLKVFDHLRVYGACILFPILFVFVLTAKVSSEQSASDKRETAYRANNTGVALLEQYKPKDAVESFQRALAIDPDLQLAQVNLSIALYYAPDPENAKRAAEKALARDPNAPQALIQLRAPRVDSGQPSMVS